MQIKLKCLERVTVLVEEEKALQYYALDLDIDNNLILQRLGRTEKDDNTT